MDLHTIRNEISSYQQRAIRAQSFTEFEDACDHIMIVDTELARATNTKPSDIRRLVMMRPFNMVDYANGLLRGR
jgi:hypothetical protein